MSQPEPERGLYSVADRVVDLLEQACRNQGMSYPEAQHAASNLLDQYDRQVLTELQKETGKMS